jgi:hypothetical protein
MDCSICMDAITKQTGSTTLSCDHVFHFRCIDNWFGKQVWDGLEQTCPCCRNAGTELDRCEVMNEEDVEDDEEDDDETYADAESETATDMPDDEELEDIRWERLGPGRWIITTSRELAMEGIRNLFGPLNELDVEESSEEIAARKIQAIYRGYQERSAFAMKQAVHALVHLSQLPVY